MLQAFAASGVPARLQGGQGTTWEVDGVVLKPISTSPASHDEANWIATVMECLPEAGFRVPRPIRSVDGQWVVDGWTASQRVDGEHALVDRWVDVLEVGGRFHDALAGIPRPAFLDRRRNPWSVGDEAAWCDTQPVVGDIFRPLVERLWNFLSPIAGASQIIHGDLTANVLFARHLDPAVIDFSPYFRPAGFALAIVVVDAIAWHGAQLAIARHLDHVSDRDQLIARAAIYRLVTADQVARTRPTGWSALQVAAHEPCAELVGVTRS